MIHSTSPTSHLGGVTPDHDVPASAPVSQSPLPSQTRPGDSAPPGAGQGVNSFARRLRSATPRESGAPRFNPANGGSFADQFNAAVNSGVGQILGRGSLSSAQFGKQMSSFADHVENILARAGGAAPLNVESDVNEALSRFIDQFHAALGTAHQSQAGPSSDIRASRGNRMATRGGPRDSSPVRHASVQDDADEVMFAGASAPPMTPPNGVRSPYPSGFRDSMATSMMSQAGEAPLPSVPARPLSTASENSFVTAQSNPVNSIPAARELHVSAAPPPSHSGTQPSENEQVAALTQRLEEMGRRFDALNEEKQTLLAQNEQLQESVRLLQEQTQLLQQQTDLLRKQVAMADKMVPEAMDHMMKSFEVFANIMKKAGETAGHITR